MLLEEPQHLVSEQVRRRDQTSDGMRPGESAPGVTIDQDPLVAVKFVLIWGILKRIFRIVAAVS